MASEDDNRCFNRITHEILNDSDHGGDPEFVDPGVSAWKVVEALRLIWKQVGGRVEPRWDEIRKPWLREDFVSKFGPIDGD